MLKKVLLILLLALIVIQFFRPAKNVSEGPQPNALAHKYPIPADVKTILEKACLDCHSNNTKYPWYAQVQPVAWWLNRHIKDGKKHFNMDEFTHRKPAYQYHKMEEVVEMVEEGEMPLKSYTWAHRDARLTADEKNKLISWARAVMQTMESEYPKENLREEKKD